MDRRIKKQNHHLLHHIVEHILSRLPVKSLLRFRVVCRQWKTTISDDPRFVNTHLRLSRNSPCTRLLVQVDPPQASDTSAARIVDVSNDDEIRVITAIDYPPPELLSPYGAHTLCHCDGLHLMKGPGQNDYVLWNPSNRTYKQLSYPYPFDENRPGRTKFGIYCDPDPLVMNNYKVVIGDGKGYAVFNCGSNCWSEMREAENTFFSKYSFAASGASLNGSIYWGVYTEEDDGIFGRDWCEIVCFDGRDEKLKNVRRFDTAFVEEVDLISSPRALYVFLMNRVMKMEVIIRVMKMEVGADDDEGAYKWEKVRAKTVQLPYGDDDDDGYKFISARPRCWSHEEKILVEVLPDRIFILYDHKTEFVAKIDKRKDHPWFRGRMFPHMENMVLLNH